ncbi:MAG TPA: winged helix-turn-helix domain-containing protein [Rhodoglobus sp.]|nr:winged helix-turn-helix domain-containing protein [Rhodoglobus sp.]
MDEEALAAARARALSSPLRLRILRSCLHEGKTNKQLAGEFGINAGSMLHHVRALVSTGLLRAEEPRRGTRGAREVPYRATGISWGTFVPGVSTILVQTFLQEIDGLDPESLDVTRMGLKLTPEHREEFGRELRELIKRWHDRGPDGGGEAFSVFSVVHPER